MKYEKKNFFFELFVFYLWCNRKKKKKKKKKIEKKKKKIKKIM